MANSKEERNLIDETGNNNHRCENERNDVIAFFEDIQQPSLDEPLCPNNGYLPLEVVTCQIGLDRSGDSSQIRVCTEVERDLQISPKIIIDQNQENLKSFENGNYEEENSRTETKNKKILYKIKSLNEENKTMETQSVQLPQIFNNEKDPQSFEWTNATTKLLLEQYLKYKQEFRNPKVKKTVIWRQILTEFENKGYKLLTWEALDTKFRNLKKTFIRILENNRKGKTVRWQYYKIFQDIFHDDATVASTISSTVQRKTNEQSEIHTPSTIQGPLHMFPGFSFTSLKRPASVLEEDEVSEEEMKKNKVKDQSRRWQKLEDQRREMIQIENRRLLVLQEIAHTMKENNKIQLERNQILKDILDRLNS